MLPAGKRRNRALAKTGVRHVGQGLPAPKQVAVTPGTGKVDFRALMARLKQGGFVGGPLVIECLAPGELPALQQEAQKARAFMEDVVRT